MKSSQIFQMKIGTHSNLQKNVKIKFVSCNKFKLPLSPKNWLCDKLKRAFFKKPRGDDSGQTHALPSPFLRHTSFLNKLKKKKKEERNTERIRMNETSQQIFGNQKTGRLMDGTGKTRQRAFQRRDRNDGSFQNLAGSKFTAKEPQIMLTSCWLSSCQLNGRALLIKGIGQPRSKWK